jgi:hypothetical protein
LNSDDGVISGTSGLKSSGGDDGVLVFQSKGTETARINTDKQIVAAAGTASLPVITTTGDLNTGIFFPAADTIAFAEGGAEAMRITSDGRLGIGTTSPNYPLNVQGSGDTFVGITGGTSNVAALLLGDADNKSIGRVSYDNSNNSLQFWANESERMRIDSSGNLLVGTTSASAKVDIVQAANTVGLEVNATDASYTSSVIDLQASRNTTNASYYFFSASISGVQTKIRIADSGNVINVNGSYGTISDAKLKTDIVDAGSQWADIKAVKFRKFKMIDDPDQRVQLGVIAQEIEQVSAGLIEEHTDRDADDNDLGTTTKSVKTSVLLMKAAVALQEAMERIETLEAKVAALEAVPGNE